MIAGFVAAGVTDAVISPGSRSTPLALAMLRQPRLRCHVAIDERSAAFFGLGIAKVQQRPVLLLATSGTAPANWLPAIIEASQSGVPLIAISADRPPELHACGANQTINQSGMFAPHVRASHMLGTPFPGFDPGYLHRLAAQIHEQSSWPYPGPVHINQPFREPLLSVEPIVSDDVPVRLEATYAKPEADARQVADLAKRISGRPGIIVCGEMPADQAQKASLTALAARLGCPVLAEPLSGLRFGPHDRSHVCIGYNRWLDDKSKQEPPTPEWIIRLGAFPVTRNLQHYVSRRIETHIAVDPWPRWIDPSRQITHLLRADPGTFCEALLREQLVPATSSWLASFSALEQQVIQNREPSHIAVLLDELPAETALFIGNSLAIRQLDSLSGHAAKTLHLYANRGASGIDGNISTAAGIARVKGSTVALIGDLTCQHDIGGLALTRGLDIVIITVNNGGGGIFDYLPQHSLPEFVEGWRTPQEIDFEHAAKTFGLTYQCSQSASELRSSLRQALATGGAHLIELKQL